MLNNLQFLGVRLKRYSDFIIITSLTMKICFYIIISLKAIKMLITFCVGSFFLLVLEIVRISKQDILIFAPKGEIKCLI